MGWGRDQLIAVVRRRWRERRRDFLGVEEDSSRSVNSGTFFAKGVSLKTTEEQDILTGRRKVIAERQFPYKTLRVAPI